MYPLVSIINKPLVFPRPANGADSSIYKPKTVVVKGSTFVKHSIRVLLDSKWIQDKIIPGCDSVMMQIEDIVEPAMFDTIHKTGTGFANLLTMSM